MANQKSPKTFVLDVSVLIHDPKAPLYFEENTVLIPTLTIKNLKEEAAKPGERGANARDALRTLMELFHDSTSMGTRLHTPRTRRRWIWLSQQRDAFRNWMPSKT